MLTTKQHWGKENREVDEIQNRQLAFETRQHPGYEIYVVPVIVGALGSGIKALKVNLKIFNNELLEEVVAVMQKTVLMDSESIV